jgi:hypothetical protein
MADYILGHGWIVILVLALLGFAFVIAGIVALGREGLRLGKRVTDMAELELTATIDATLAKVDNVQTRVDEIPMMLERAKSALLSIQASRQRLQRQMQTATAAFNFARAIFSKPTQ